MNELLRQAVPLRRPVALRQTLAALVGVAAVVVGLAYLPGRIRHVDGEVASFATVSPQDRILREANAVGVDTGVYLLARRVIPPGATYYVTTGPGAPASTSSTDAGVEPFGLLFLLPRMPVLDAHDARYVLSYGGDPKSLGVPLGRVWTYKPGIEIAEVRR